LVIEQPNLEPSEKSIVGFAVQRSKAMREYRAYILEIDGKRFVMVDDFLRDHPDDQAAIKAANKLTDKHVVEVWDGGRLVAELSPNGAGLLPALAPFLVAAPSIAHSEPKHPMGLKEVSELTSVTPQESIF
jgi:hypothetical protein